MKLYDIANRKNAIKAHPSDFDYLLYRSNITKKVRRLHKTHFDKKLVEQIRTHFPKALLAHSKMWQSYYDFIFSVKAFYSARG